MKEQLFNELSRKYPLMFSGSHKGYINSYINTGDGWYEILDQLLSKLEPIAARQIQRDSNLECSKCGCGRNKHYGNGTRNPGKCLAICIDSDSKEEPPGNYYSCSCEKYLGTHLRVAQVKAKFGGLRFYVDNVPEEESERVYELISKAETESFKICELCGKSGKIRKQGWGETLCATCFHGDEIIET